MRGSEGLGFRLRAIWICLSLLLVAVYYYFGLSFNVIVFVLRQLRGVSPLCGIGLAKAVVPF